MMSKDSDILHNLDAIDWDKFSAMESGAAEIPALFREILYTTDESELRWKLRALYDRVIHQGLSFSHTASMVPIIVETLSYDKSQPIKAFWLGMLTDIAQSIYIETRPVKYEEYAKQARLEVRNGISVYLRLLSDEDTFVKTAASELVAELRKSDR
ncbi:MAG: hypothetical protein ACYDBJ_17255 [Aggregatilineales bacterium]